MRAPARKKAGRKDGVDAQLASDVQRVYCLALISDNHRRGAHDQRAYRASSVITASASENS